MAPTLGHRPIASSIRHLFCAQSRPVPQRLRKLARALRINGGRADALSILSKWCGNRVALVPHSIPRQVFARQMRREFVTSKVWFITGASSGFGREWTLAAIRRGDRVAAAARDNAALEKIDSDFRDAILPLQLDVTDRASAFVAVATAYEHFGRLDVVVNNAGYGQHGFVEELSENDVRAQMETNFFGAVWITQAALPYLRRQRSGHILQVTSAAGLVSVAERAMYSASKFALEGCQKV